MHFDQWVPAGGSQSPSSEMLRPLSETTLFILSRLKLKNLYPKPSGARAGRFSCWQLFPSQRLQKS
jgi:hypothetical protein